MSLIYDVFEDRVVVKKYEYDEGVDIVCIPQKIGGIYVTEIAPRAFYKMANLKTVIIPMNLKRIGEEAFAECEQLTCVGVAEDRKHSVFPPTLRYIGESAFRHTGLRELSFASKRIDLDRFCFMESKVISAFFLGTDITLEEGAFRESDMRFVLMENAQIDQIGDGCFAFCKDLQTIRAKRINSIGKDCFRECVSLAEFFAKKPLNHIGDGAFYFCRSLKMEGYCRTMGDLIRARGIDYMLSETIERKCPSASWLPENYGTTNFKIANAAKNIADKIKNTEFRITTDFVILRVIGSDYHGPKFGWRSADRFLLYAKQDVCEQFENVWDWEIIEEDDEYVMPPAVCIDELSTNEIIHMLQYENTPKPCIINWDNLDMLLNAELGGDAVRFSGATAMSFLSCLIEHEIGKTPKVYRDIPFAELLKNHLGGTSGIFAEADAIQYLTWGVLFNRIAIYRELKHAHYQLTWDEKN